MTEEQALAQLLKLIDNDDSEAAHAKADDILVEFLRSQGYVGLADAYDEVSKWYA